MNRKVILGLGLLLVLNLGTHVFGSEKIYKTGLLPFKSLDVDTVSVNTLSSKLLINFQARPFFNVIDKDLLKKSLLDSANNTCIQQSCFVGAGKKLGADWILSGTVVKSGELYNITIGALDITNEKTTWNKEYRASISSFESALPEKILSDFVAYLFPPVVISQPEPPAQVYAQPTPTYTRPSSLEVSEGDQESSFESQRQKKNGIVNGPTYGANGRLALGTLSSHESRWGVDGLFLYPTSKNSQLRIRGGVPTSRSENLMDSSDFTNPDISAGVEHEWGWSYFGVTFGAQYLYMAPFKSSTGAVFDRTDALNWVIGFRGGMPNKGFRGRISYPMPFEMYNNLNNYFFDYSAIGIFGRGNFKGGIGVQGFVKERTGKRASQPYNSNYGYNYSYYDYYDYVSESEYFAMVPCGKVAILVNDNMVVSFGVDLAGLFLPRPSSGSYWAPNATFGLIYSLGKLTTPETFDGKF